MGRPCERYPKRNAISFRVSDVDLAGLKYLAKQAEKPGETFSETLGRVIREVLIMSAEKEFFARREKLEAEKVSVSLTREDVDKRRRNYRAELMRGVKWARKQAEIESPQRAELACPSAVVVARLDADPRLQADERGQSGQKSDGSSSPLQGSGAHGAPEFAGKNAVFAENRVEAADFSPSELTSAH